MSNLRWIERDGVRTLQSAYLLDGEKIWQDIPTHQESKPTFKVKWEGEDSGRPMKSCCQCGETIPVEFLGAEMHWCQPKYTNGCAGTYKDKPKNVTVEDELTKIIRGMRDPDVYASDDIAKAAIEFFKKRMLPVMEVQYDTFGNRRESYHGDCHKALFGEA